MTQRAPSPPIEESALLRELQLQREAVNPEQIWMSFLERLIGWSDAATHWRTIKIVSRNHNRHILTYMMSVNLEAFVIINATLADDENPRERYTDARLWQLVVDSWIFHGGSPSNLRWLGVSQIENVQSVSSMRHEFGGSQRAWLVVPDASPFRDGNLFVRSGERIANELTGRNDGAEIAIRRLVYNQILTGDEDSRYNILICLGTEGDATADVFQTIDTIEQDEQRPDRAGTTPNEDEIVFQPRRNRGKLGTR